MKICTHNSKGHNVVILFCMLAVLLFSFSARSEELVDATADYDTNNVFARILRGELPAESQHHFI